MIIIIIRNYGLVRKIYIINQAFLMMTIVLMIHRQDCKN